MLDIYDLTPHLVSDEKFRKSLFNEFGEKYATKLLSQLERDSEEIYSNIDFQDFLSYQLSCESETVWSGFSFSPDDPENIDSQFPFRVMEYAGRFYVTALELEDEGFFQSCEDAKEYIYNTFDYICEEGQIPSTDLPNPYITIAPKPTEEIFLCKYELFIGAVAEVDESLYLQRYEDRDEIYVTHPWTSGISIPKSSDPLNAGLQLLELVLKKKCGFEWPSRFLEAGLLDEQMFNKVKTKVEIEFEEYRKLKSDI